MWRRKKRREKPQQTDGRSSATRGVSRFDRDGRGKPRGGAAACSVNGQIFNQEVLLRTTCSVFSTKKKPTRRALGPVIDGASMLEEKILMVFMRLIPLQRLESQSKTLYCTVFFTVNFLRSSLIVLGRSKTPTTLPQHHFHFVCQYVDS